MFQPPSLRRPTSRYRRSSHMLERRWTSTRATTPCSSSSTTGSSRTRLPSISSRSTTTTSSPISRPMRRRSSASTRCATESRTSSTTTCEMGLTSSRRSWTTGMSNWARKRWNSRGRVNKMADTVTTVTDPQLTDRTPQPKGVLQKNLKMFLYLGAVVLLLLATVISSRKKAPTAADKAKDAPPQPYVQDNTASNVDALQRQLGADKLKAQQDAQLAAATGSPVGGTGAQQGAAAAYAPDGQQNGTQANGQPQLTPVQQAGEQLAATEKERADAARFSSNITYASSPEQPATRNQSPQPSAAQNPYAAAIQAGQPTGLTAPRAAGEPRASGDQIPATEYKRPSEANIDNAIGQP